MKASEVKQLSLKELQEKTSALEERTVQFALSGKKWVS